MSKQVPFISILPLLFISCAGIPHPVVESQALKEPLGLCHAGGRGIEEKALLDSLGIDWVRLDMSWKRIQSQPGEFDFEAYDRMFDNTDAAGVKVLGILSYDTPWIHEDPEGKRQVDPEDFAHWLEFAEAVALRYRHRLGALEIWNEPNSNRFWTGSDEDFFSLTRETVTLLKAAVPEIPVVAGGIIYNPFLGSGRYLREFLESGAADNADAISLHPYGISPSSAARRLYQAGEILDEYDFDGELWITEVGFPTGGSYPHAVEEENLGAYLVKTVASSFASGVDRLFWYHLYDRFPEGEAPPGTSSEAFFGIVYPGGEMKSGGLAMAYLGPSLRDAHWAPELLEKQAPANIPVAVYPFRLSDNTVMIVAWSRMGRPRLALEGFIGDIEIFDTRLSEISVTDSNNQIQLGPEPLIISGRMNSPIVFRAQ